MRIRTIKPEFPQSESVGRVSRDARLLFILLWPLCDDEGRTRAASRLLASLLFPYDEDAPKRIDGWIAELEREDMVRRYSTHGDTYLEVRNWAKHQRIDRPSPSKIPPFDESSRALANPREPSCEDRDQGSGIKDQGSKDQGSYDPSTRRQAVEEQFAEFWTAYPRREGKQAARKAFEKLPDHPRIVTAARQYAAAVAQWRPEERKYVPHPATWLNQGRYDDDPATWLRNAPPDNLPLETESDGMTPKF